MMQASQSEPSDELWRFDLARTAWTCVQCGAAAAGTRPPARSLHVAGLVRHGDTDVMVIFGGLQKVELK